MVFTGLNQGKTDVVTNFILIYLSLEIIILLLSRKIAAVKENNASKVIRVFELGKNGLAIHQIAEILEEEGYKSIRGRGKLEKSAAKIIEKGNLKKALKIKQLGFTELSHKISKNILCLLLRVMVVIIFFYFIYINAPELTIAKLTPSPPGPVEVGSSIQWNIEIDKTPDTRFNYRIYVDGRMNDSDYSIYSSSFSWTWHTSGEKSGAHRIMVEVWPEGYYDKKKTENSTYELYNEKPFIKKVDYYYEKHGSEFTELEAPKGTIVHCKVHATDPDPEDILYYEFSVGGYIKQGPSDSDEWLWDTSKYSEGDHEIYVRVIDGKDHANDLPIGDEKSYKINAVNLKLKSDHYFASIDTEVELTISVPEEIVTSRSLAGKPPMQYKFYDNGSSLTSWLDRNTYTWNTESTTEGTHEISGKMRFAENSKSDDCDAETSIRKVRIKLQTFKPPTL